jgi:hypothetical protein
VTADETFMVRGKLTSGFAGGQDVPMLFRGEKFTLPYASLEPFIELVAERQTTASQAIYPLQPAGS